MLTPHCSAASGIVVPPSIVSTTRLRKSAEYGFAIHAGLFPAGSLNHIRAAMGIPDSAFPGNALAAAQGTSGSTGAVASIPSSVVRGGEQGRPVTQTGLISIIAGSAPPDPNSNSKQNGVRRDGATPPIK